MTTLLDSLRVVHVEGKGDVNLELLRSLVVQRSLPTITTRVILSSDADAMMVLPVADIASVEIVGGKMWWLLGLGIGAGIDAALVTGPLRGSGGGGRGCGPAPLGVRPGR